MFQLPQFVWTLRSSGLDGFINFLLIDATDRSKISSDKRRFFIAFSLYPLSFFANTPFNVETCALQCLNVYFQGYGVFRTMQTFCMDNDFAFFRTFEGWLGFGGILTRKQFYCALNIIKGLNKVLKSGHMVTLGDIENFKVLQNKI